MLCKKKIFFLAINGMFCLLSFAQQNHVINLTLDIKPYTNSRDIQAHVLINHNYRTSIKADNSSFARIYKQIPKLPGDSLIEVQIVIYSPTDYIAIEETMPFKYFSGDDRSVRVVSKEWGKVHALALSKYMTRSQKYDTSISFINAILREDLYRNTADEVELTKLLSKSYAAIGDYEESYFSLSNVSSNKIKSLNTNQQREYFIELIDKFKLTVLNDTANKAISNDYLASIIVQNDTTYKNWKLLTNKFLAVPIGKSLNVSLFNEPIQTEKDIIIQLAELNNKLHSKPRKE